MITKTLAPGDPLARSPPAVKAIMDKLAEFRERTVWDESNPVEASEVALKEPERHIVKVFAMVGTKHYEDKCAQRYQGRTVVSGDKVNKATGQYAFFRNQKSPIHPGSLSNTARRLFPNDEHEAAAERLYPRIRPGSYEAEADVHPSPESVVAQTLGFTLLPNDLPVPSGAVRPSRRQGFVARQDRTEILLLKLNIVEGLPSVFILYLSNPKPGHTTGGSGRGAQRSGQAGSGKIGCQQNYSPRKKKVYRILQGIEETSLQHLPRSTNKRNPM